MRRALLFAALAAGCTTLGPEPEAPPAPQGGFEAVSGSAGTATGRATGEDLAVWWRGLGDPALTRLIEEGALGNLQLAQAEARLRAARAERAQARGGAGPSLDASGSATRTRISENGFPFGGATGGGVAGGGTESPAASRKQSASAQAEDTGGAAPGGASSNFPTPGDTINIFQLGFDARWELDLFGGLTRTLQAADARVAASAYELADLRTSLVAEIARDYVSLRIAQARLGAAEANLEAAQEVASLVEERADAGFVTELDSLRAAAAIDAISVQLPPLRATIAQTGHRLSILTGERPGSLADLLDPAPPPVPEDGAIPVGVPADLVRRRPDIRAAEAQLRAATYAIGASQADLYPNIALTGQVGLQSQDADSLFDWGSRTWSLGADVLAPIFDRGRRRARVEQRRAEAEGALAAYRLAVLTAIGEVEDAIVGLREDRLRLTTVEALADKNRRALALARERYAAGLVTLLDVLEAQQDLVSAEDQLAQARGAVTIDAAALFKALGGGWPADDATKEGEDI
ncbi:efflux transporter outer membrane subunit [Parvularcula dongshanensis]|uniref:NodT family efflux transporter outer membrane factor (OMF) lipoprotein n=1 Tax=Parvularcula dongshanensis TaxID=1173995 RepID=A0A840I5W5_9PROT|nr:efflux transporter outer membrane subunit [Parvularcula dongshanensis]MBB4659661.1 NodT family efflux transporter outer membrane factor (OMF) lipoprotein [Parvularcula dongshanensis]